MADFKRVYDTEGNHGISDTDVDDTGVTSQMISMSNGQYRGAQVSIQLDNKSGSVTDDLLVEIYSSRNDLAIDSFPATELRLHPATVNAERITFDVPDSLIGHGFNVKLLSSGSTDDYECTLYVQRYKISDT